MLCRPRRLLVVEDDVDRCRVVGELAELALEPHPERGLETAGDGHADHLCDGLRFFRVRCPAGVEPHAMVRRVAVELHAPTPAGLSGWVAVRVDRVDEQPNRRRPYHDHTAWSHTPTSQRES